MLNLPHQPTGNLDFSNILQVVAFDDDSLEILFKDKSILQLSPCGANFKYTRPHPGTMPSLSKHLNEITQRCVFATSETRVKVIQAILIRNTICSCPYLHSDLLHEMGMTPFRIHRVLKSIEWPGSAKSQKLIDEDTGNITIHSKDNFAELTLFADKHRVKVSYASVISDRERMGRKTTGEKDQNTDAKNQVMCVWQSKIFPASACPPEWQYPLELAIQLKLNNDFDLKLKSKTFVPQTLSKSCSRQFSHTWRDVIAPAVLEEPVSLLDSNSVTDHSRCSKMRYTWCENVSQWIVINASDFSTKIEAWLPDGGVFKTHPTSERYFIHFRPTSLNSSDTNCSEMYEEKIISSASIPERNSLLKSVMLRSIRLMLYEQEHRFSQVHSDNTMTCWKVLQRDNQQEDMDSDSEACLDEIKNCSIQDTIHIPCVGTFSVVDNSIQITFDDKSVMHMSVNIRDLSKLGIQQLNSLIGQDQCRLMLYSGQYFIINDMDKPQQDAEEYVRHAIAWLEWLSKSVEHRTQHPFYSGTIYDIENISMVSQELEKISSFTNSSEKQCKIDTADFPPYLELSGQIEKSSGIYHSNAQCQNVQDVSKALSHTSKKIGELDEILSLFKKTNT